MEIKIGEYYKLNMKDNYISLWSICNNNFKTVLHPDTGEI
jgi:hypothetical protein